MENYIVESKSRKDLRNLAETLRRFLKLEDGIVITYFKPANGYKYYLSEKEHKKR